MKNLLGILAATTAAMLLYMVDITAESSQNLPGFSLVSEAHAVAGRQRRTTRRRSVAVGYSAGKQSSAAQQQAAPPPQQSAPTAESK